MSRELKQDAQCTVRRYETNELFTRLHTIVLAVHERRYVEYACYHAANAIFGKVATAVPKNVVLHHA